MEWKVYTEDFTNKEVKLFNVFDHFRFRTGVEKAFKECNGNKIDFSKRVRSEAIYYYAWKCEYEVYVSSMWKKEPLKIDVFQQLEINWDKFIDYTWNALKSQI